MSKKKLQNEKPKQQNDGFWIAVVLIVCSYIVSIALIICAFCTKAKIANNNLYNSLGIACQVVASLCTCVLSILQISFSLQDNTFLGISVRVLYRMRKKTSFWICGKRVNLSRFYYHCYARIYSRKSVCMYCSSDIVNFILRLFNHY